MNPEELDLISIHEAPILSTMKRIYSAVPVHHLAAIHGKIVGALAVADQMICRNEVETNEGSVNLVNFPTQRNALKFQEMARLLTQMGIKINKICFDHTTAEDMMDLARADLNITGYRMPWAELMKDEMNVGYCKITG